MPHVKISIEGSVDGYAARFDGAELTFSKGVWENDVGVGVHDFFCQVRGQNGNKFSIKIERDGGSTIEKKCEIVDSHVANEEIQFTVREKQ